MDDVIVCGVGEFENLSDIVLRGVLLDDKIVGLIGKGIFGNDERTFCER